MSSPSPRIALSACVLAGCLASVQTASAMRRREALESFEYRELVLVGTRKEANGTWIACFAAPGRAVAAVRIGNYIGSREGRIQAIDQRSVLVSELELLNGNEWFERELRWYIASAQNRRGRACP